MVLNRSRGTATEVKEVFYIFVKQKNNNNKKMEQKRRYATEILNNGFKYHDHLMAGIYLLY